MEVPESVLTTLLGPTGDFGGAARGLQLRHRQTLGFADLSRW